jgi:hypothetical protein
MASNAIEMRSPEVSSMSSSRPGGSGLTLVRQVQQLVGGVAHRGDHHDDVVAGLAGSDDALGDALDPLRVGHGRTTVLLHEQRHRELSPRDGPVNPGT